MIFKNFLRRTVLFMISMQLMRTEEKLFIAVFKMSMQVSLELFLREPGRLRFFIIGILK